LRGVLRRLLQQIGYSRQGNAKAEEGRQHPDQDAQFEHINERVLEFQAAQQPVISVDTKKKELIGNFKNAGSDYRPQGSPQRVNVHDFEDWSAATLCAPSFAALPPAWRSFSRPISMAAPGRPRSLARPAAAGRLASSRRDR
jgi:hypothetical protein